MAKKTKKKTSKKVATLTHKEASRTNIPTAEYQSVMEKEHQTPIQLAYQRRNRDLDPQLVWRGKDEQDCSDLVVQAPPLFIQEKVHPKVLIDDLLRQTKSDENAEDAQLDLFAEFNGLPDTAVKTEFYAHEQNWSNRMILGDSLQVMASLAEREGLRGKVQCIYLDPPYGIKFNSNFQWSTTSRDVKDGKFDHITREPEQVRAFRDTWRDGIHSYLTYLRDRLTVARELLTESGSVFVQIGDENLHVVRALLDEVFGATNFCSVITFAKTSSASSERLAGVSDYLLWYAKHRDTVKYRQPYQRKVLRDTTQGSYDCIESPDGSQWRRLNVTEKRDPTQILADWRVFMAGAITSSRPPGSFPVVFNGVPYRPSSGYWKTGEQGFERLIKARRIVEVNGKLRYRRYFEDFPVSPLNNLWTDTTTGTYTEPKVYVVQTGIRPIERAVLMTTDPGDLVLDPTCGSGTTAYVAEQWGRRWITIDTSRVALALARARIMGARYPFYLLADSSEGQLKEAEITHIAPSSQPVQGNIRHGFVYERVPHITLKSIANDSAVDVIWEHWQATLEPLRESLNAAVNRTWQEWDIPRKAEAEWSDTAKKVHADWWQARIARQHEIDKSIAAKAEFEYLYDRPFDDKKKVRVAGPFTVESLSPHRILGVDENDDLIDSLAEAKLGYGAKQDFAAIILDNLKSAGIQQAHREDKVVFSSIQPWPGKFICAEGRYLEGNGKSESEKRAAILVGPEFGTVSKPDLVAAGREAGDADFDVLVSCAFNYDAHSSEFDKLGRVPVLKARMNADLHMADDLKNTGTGNLFVIFGEPDIDIIPVEEDGVANGQIRVKVNGVDVFHPNTGEVRSDGAEGIACWFIDTDYNEESFFVRHAYFLGAADPYKSLKTTLKAEINAEAWATLHSDISRPFDKPESGRIAVKVINHLGDEVMKVFRVD